jgi:hypothetical protein
MQKGRPIRAFRAFALSLVLAPYAFTQSPAQNLWDSLAAKRAKLATWHEEFQVTRIAGDYSSQWTAILDVAKGQWREKSVTGGGTTARIFDGNQLFLAEEGSNEFVRPKLQSDSDRDVPIPYAGDRIWSKAADVQRRPCGIPGKGYQCVILEVPSSQAHASVRHSRQGGSCAARSG